MCLAAIAKAIAVEIIWVCCCRRRRHHHRRCCWCCCCSLRSRISSVFYSITLCLLFIYFFFRSAPSDWESLKSGPEQCECVHVLNFLFRFMPFSFVPLSLLPVLILYERCFSYSTSMVFFLFFLVIFFYCVFRLSGKSRSVLCCFFSLVLSFRLLAYLFIFFFLSVEFCMILVGECIHYYCCCCWWWWWWWCYYTAHFILFFSPYFFPSEAFHVEYVNGFIHIYFSQFFFSFLLSSLCYSIFFRSFPACVSMWCVCVYVFSFHVSRTQSAFCISLSSPSVLIRSSYLNHCACLLSFMFREL